MVVPVDVVLGGLTPLDKSIWFLYHVQLPWVIFKGESLLDCHLPGFENWRVLPHELPSSPQFIINPYQNWNLTKSADIYSVAINELQFLHKSKLPFASHIAKMLYFGWWHIPTTWKLTENEVIIFVWLKTLIIFPLEIYRNSCLADDVQSSDSPLSNFEDLISFPSALISYTYSLLFPIINLFGDTLSNEWIDRRLSLDP